MKVIPILIISLLLFAGNTLAQIDKLKPLYENGEYEKCLEKAKKSYLKSSKKNEILMIQALCYHGIAKSEINLSYPKNQTSINRSLQIVKRIQARKNSDEILNRYKIELGTIRETAQEVIDKLVEMEEFVAAAKMYSLLHTIFLDYIYNIEKGKLLMEAGENGEGILSINSGLSSIKHHHKSSPQEIEKLDLYLLSLADFFLKKDYKIHALQLYDFLHELEMQNKNVVNAHYHSLEEIFNDYFNLEKVDLQLKRIDDAKEFYKQDSVFNSLYPILLDRGMQYINHKLLLSYGMQKSVNDYLYALLAKVDNRSKFFQLINQELIDQLIISFKDDKIQLPKDILELVVKLNEEENLVDGEDFLKERIELLLSNERFKDATILYMVSVKKYKESKLLKSIEPDVVKYFHDQLVKMNNTFEDWERLSNYRKIFEDEERMKAREEEMLEKLIDSFIEENEYSEAGILLQYARKHHPENKKVLELKKAWTINDYKANYLTTGVSNKELDWTGVPEKCYAGTISKEAHKKTLQRLNYFRRLAGVPDQCIFNPELDRKCQAAALIMNANFSLTHHPDKTWKCFSEAGETGAGNTNLSLGNHSSEAIKGQMRDGGSNNYAAGHRRWIINPLKKVYGHGSTINSMALWSLGGTKSKDGEYIQMYYNDSVMKRYSYDYVTWPPQDFVPRSLVFRRWSFSLKNANFENTEIEMYIEGKKVELETETLRQGYGLNTIVWRPQFSGINYLEKEIKVKVKNVKTRQDSELVDFEYIVRVIGI